ncbi:MAG: hypothetical protein ABF649_14690 [Bacillus sp. (in: firmicutes)]
MKKADIGFVAAGSIMTLIFLVIVHFITGSHYPWFIYPFFFMLLWSVSYMCMKTNGYKMLSLLDSVILFVFLMIINRINTPDYPWFLYAIYPILCWPILIYLEEKAKSLSTALIGSIGAILYYFILNMIFSPSYLWFIYPAFLVMWWPLSVYHAKKQTYFRFSVHGSILIIIFFILVNSISSPDTIWAVYPIFAVLWWPLSMYYYAYKPKKIN